MVNIFGYSICYVVTPSMVPTLEVGDVILIKRVAADQVNEQDIITFKSVEGVLSGEYITHRVVDITGEGQGIEFTTKGDANNFEDEHSVLPYQLEGVFVRKLGIIMFFTSALSNIVVFFFVIIAPLLLLLGLQIMHFVLAVKDNN